LYAFVLPVVGARAQPPADDAEYRVAVEEALAEYAAQNYAEARTLFARAHSLYPNARTLRGLGAVCFELRQYHQSVAFLEQALSSQEKSLDDVMRAEVTRLLARARAFVGELKVTVEPRTTVVSIDGEEPVAVFSLPFSLDVGSHQLDFSAAGYVSERRTAIVEGGERKAWTITLHASAAKPVALAPVQAPREQSPARLVTLGAAIASGVITGLAVGMREKQARQIQDSCAVHSDDCDDMQASGRRWRATAIAGGVVTSVLTATTITLFALGRPGESSPRIARGSCDLGLFEPSLRCTTHF
jgi:hypothetical protein